MYIRYFDVPRYHSLDVDKFYRCLIRYNWPSA